MEHVKRIKRDLVHKGSILDMYCDTMQSPDGHISHWDYLQHRKAAAILPIDRDGKILLVRQYRNSVDRITLEIPAGGLNSDQEPTAEAAARELEEETGFRAGKLDFFLSLVTAIAFCNEIIDVYLARDLIPTHQNLDPDEFIEIEAFSLPELLTMIRKQKIQDSKTVAAIMAYKVHMDEEAASDENKKKDENSR